MSNRDELIAQFIEISGGEDSVARFYLSSSNWSLEDALANFLGTQGDHNETHDEISDEVSLDNPSTTNIENAGKDEGFQKSSERPKYGTLKDLEQRSSNEDEGQAFYAGGSERSGQQVLGPPKRKNFREQLTDMFRMAQDQSAADDDAQPSTSRSNWGQGIRLGITQSDHSVPLPQSQTTEGSGETKKPSVVLKLWQQGFSIDDGELRLYDNPENKEFLQTVMRGEIPHELLEVGMMVNVDVEDHRHENYKKLTVTKNFKGPGHTLGSPAPDFEEIPHVVSAPVAVDKTTNADNENSAKEKLAVISSEPTTTLQIRLDDGTRLAAQFNLTHTVGDIHQYIQNARPQYVNRSFILVSSFPTREITDVNATVEGAGLKNCSVFLRML